MYKAIVFDFDYTLGDSTEGIIESVNYALTSMGYKAAEREAITKTIGLSLERTFSVLTDCEDMLQAEQFERFFKEKADEVMAPSTRLYDGVPQLLERLRRNGKLIGIVTTKYHYRIEQILKLSGQSGLVDCIVGGDDVKVPKPAPEGLFLATRNMNVKKSEALYIGDSIVDAETAQRACVDFSAVTTGTTAAEDFMCYPHIAVMKSLSELDKYIGL